MSYVKLIHGNIGMENSLSSAQILDLGCERWLLRIQALGNRAADVSENGLADLVI